MKKKERVRYTIETTVGKSDAYFWPLLAWICEQYIWYGEDAWFKREKLPPKPSKI